MGRLIGRRNDRRRQGFGGVALAVALGGGVGAALLLVAEFTPLLSVRSSASATAIDTVTTGSHDSYALVPVALLAAVLAYAVRRTGSRVALAATALLGVVVLLISLLGDLPDAQATGLVTRVPTHFALAAASPAAGLYLETLGAIVLLITAVSGLLLPAPGSDDRQLSADRTRSAL